MQRCQDNSMGGNHGVRTTGDLHAKEKNEAGSLPLRKINSKRSKA